MNIHTLKREQHIPRPLKEVFAFFSRPENLASLTPREMGFRVLTPTPISMERGTLIDYTINLMGFPVRWTTLITRYEPRISFDDVQLRGPYAYWHHRHSFRAAGKGTIMTDEVRYALPLGPLGTLVHSLFVRRQLQHIFDYRSRTLATLFPLKHRSQKKKKPVHS